MRRFNSDCRGSSAIEFAILAPITITLFFAIFWASFAVWAQAGIQRGTQEGARCAAIGAGQCTTDSMVLIYAADHTLGLNPPTTTFKVATAACGKEVSALYQYDFLSGALGLPPLTLTARSCFPA